MNVLSRTCLLPLALSAFSVLAVGYANAATWGWDSQDAANFTGQITLIDDTGSSSAYDRFDGSGTSPIWGISAVQSPVVVAGSSSPPFLSGMYRTGVTAPKLVCDAPTTWNVALSVANACTTGVARNIAGINLSYVDVSATEWTPTMKINVQGYGWLDVNNNDCGIVQAVQMCE